MEYIALKNMTFHAFHGVMEQERKVGNIFRVDLRLYIDMHKAIQTDKLEDTLNYACVFDLVKAEMAIPSNLLEHVSGRIISKLKNNFPQLKRVKIRLAKTHPPLGGEVEEVAVIIDN
ncbi:MAG: dihydroneopterin aldolase [Candidatus Symbiothrix sp.]|jgi:dihydroneopterin aldolase|nr:dihydroneopterin aldolase [Candidatus Symbiothrix sp.]